MKRPTRTQKLFWYCFDVEIGVEESLGDSILTAGKRLELSGHSLEFLYAKLSNQNWKLMFDLTHSHTGCFSWLDDYVGNSTQLLFPLFCHWKCFSNIPCFLFLAFGIFMLFLQTILTCGCPAQKDHCTVHSGSWKSRKLELVLQFWILKNSVFSLEEPVLGDVPFSSKVANSWWNISLTKVKEKGSFDLQDLLERGSPCRDLLPLPDRHLGPQLQAQVRQLLVVGVVAEQVSHKQVQYRGLRLNPRGKIVNR